MIDLAHEIRAVLAKQRVRDSFYSEIDELLTRYEAENDPPSAGRAFYRQLCQDYYGTLRRFFRLDGENQYLMTVAYLEYYKAAGGTLLLTPQQMRTSWLSSMAEIGQRYTASGHDLFSPTA